MLKTNFNFIFVNLFVGIFILLPSLSYAQTPYKLASAEDVALAYYKTGGVIPNFERWITKRAPYTNTPATLRPALLDSETERLKKTYQDFDPFKDYIYIQTKVTIKPTMQQQTFDQVTNKHHSTYNLNTTFVNAPEATYFPYELVDERIVVMPYSLQEIMNSEVSQEKYDEIAKNFHHKHELTMVFRLRPAEADFSMPYMIDGMEQWVFKTHIASADIWRDGNVLVWEYTAPWFARESTQMLNDLFEEKTEGEAQTKGIEKQVPVLTRDKEE